MHELIYKGNAERKLIFILWKTLNGSSFYAHKFNYNCGENNFKINLLSSQEMTQKHVFFYYSHTDID